MSFNPKMFSTKKKRVMDPNVIRPNLFSHEKKLKESDVTLRQLQDLVNIQKEQIQKLTTRVTWIESIVINLWNGKK